MLISDKHSKEEYFEFIKTKDPIEFDYFSGVLDRILNGGKKSTFNVAAFLFGSFWFAYRRMYGIAAAVVAVDSIIGQLIIETFSSIPEHKHHKFWYGMSMLFSVIALKILTGIYGNYLYILSIKRDLDAGRIPHKKNVNLLLSLFLVFFTIFMNYYCNFILSENKIDVDIYAGGNVLLFFVFIILAVYYNCSAKRRTQS